MKDIENEDNNVLKVQYKYFCWVGYWFGHKIAIRRENYNMQFKNLLAFFSLFQQPKKVDLLHTFYHMLMIIKITAITSTNLFYI